MLLDNTIYESCFRNFYSKFEMRTYLHFKFQRPPEIFTKTIRTKYVELIISLIILKDSVDMN